MDQIGVTKLKPNFVTKKNSNNCTGLRLICPGVYQDCLSQKFEPSWH